MVRFETRSFDLTRVRDAIRERIDPDVYRALITEFEQAVERDQADFVRAVEELGGEVTHQWWLVNGAAVRGVDAERLLRLPNVAAVDPVYIHAPGNNDARNAANHDAVGAEQFMTPGGQPLRGQGISVANLDTGADANFAGTGIPHPAYFVDGDTTNTTGGGIAGSRLLATFASAGNGTEDLVDHGTHVAGSVSGGVAGYLGLARETGIVDLKIAFEDNEGMTTDPITVAAWQTVIAQRLTYDIRVAVSAYHGSPYPANTATIVMDLASSVGDVFVSTIAGNFGTASEPTFSSWLTWNGVAVGAVEKNTFARPTFSSPGPSAIVGRTFPDLAAVGVNVTSTRLDSATPLVLSGTSMASAMVAGGAALVRSAVDSITALETKAVILNTTRGPQNDRNGRGLGVLDARAAVEAAVAGTYETVTLGRDSHYSRSFTIASTTAFDLTTTWYRLGTGVPPDLEMRILDSTGQPLAADGSLADTWEHIDVVLQPGTYALQLRRVSAPTAPTDVAIAGLTPLAAQAPSLTTATQTTLNSLTGGFVAVSGTGLDVLTDVLVDGVPTGFPISLGPNSALLELPPLAFGTHSATVANSAGTSNTLTFNVVAPRPPLLEAPLVANEGSALTLRVAAAPNALSMLFVSPDATPSLAPGIVSLGIGAGFTTLFPLASLTHDALGVGGFNVTVPPLPPGLFPLQVQAVTVYPTPPVFPLEATSVEEVLLIGS